MASLISRINDVVSSIGADIKMLLGRSLPAGGSSGQVLTKTSATDFSVSWQTPSVGGGGAGGNVYIQETDPLAASPYIWFKTNASGVVTDILKG